MTILSDFNHIIGDTTVHIGDASNSSGYTKDFSTMGRVSSRTAFISFMVKGMTVTDENADVFVNDQKIGVLFNNKGGDRDHWQTQTVSMGGGRLETGANGNTLRVAPVTYQGGGNDSFDDFSIRNVICHFHQNG